MPPLCSQGVRWSRGRRACGVSRHPKSDPRVSGTFVQPPHTTVGALLPGSQLYGLHCMSFIAV